MAKHNLKQHYRGEDGVLYRAGEGVEVPKRARLKIASEDSTGEKVPAASVKLPAAPSTGTTPADTSPPAGQ